MGKRIYFKSFAAAIASLTVTSAPTTLVAGSYGSAGVSDAEVGRYAGQATVWCERLDANVPERLFRQMDCGAPDDGIARSAVAGERVNNRSRGLGGLFGNFRHVRGNTIDTDDDDPPRNLRTTQTPTDDDEPTPVASDDPPTPSSSVGKWDRLSDLGVTPSNFGNQSESFKDQVNDYRRSNTDGDWSGFDPD